MRFKAIKIYSAALLLTGSCFSVIAQDSLNVWNINRTVSQQQDYQLTISSGLFLLQSPIKRTSFSTISYESFGGGFKLAQQGKSNNRISFQSEGIRTIKNLKLWGSFKYQSEQNDSIRFSHRTDNTDPAPFYYGSEKAVHYSRTDYQLNALAAYPLLKNTAIALALDYGMGDHYSTNDPRAVLKHFRLILKPELIYRKPGFAIGINGTYGYGQNEYQVDYRNKEYYESDSYPEYVNYLVNGYGVIRDALDFSDRVFMINRKWKGAGLQGTAKALNGEFKGSLSYLLRGEKFERGNSSGKYANKENYGIFDLKKWEAMLRYINGQWAAGLYWEQEEGKEYNVRLGGNNYLYHAQKLQFSLINTLLLQQKKLELGILLSARNANQVDGNYEIGRDRSLAGAGILVGREWLHKAQQNFRTLFSASYYLPYQTRFDFNPSKTNSFIKQVIAADAAMDLQHYLELSASAHYMIRLKSFNWQFGIEGKGVLANASRPLPSIDSYLPGRTAYRANLSASLFF